MTTATVPVAADGALVRFLDGLRAAEAASARVFAAWVEVCALDGLRGGLRVIAEREAGHAELAAERLRELGGACEAEVRGAAVEAALACFGSAETSDEEKLRLVLARYPDDRSATRALEIVVAGLHDDPETREILRLIVQGEVATMSWLRAYHDGLAARTVPPPPAA